jgi:hypothetical protein
MRNKKNNKIISYLLLFILIISFISTSMIQNVFADSGSGSGNEGTPGTGAGVWWHTESGDNKSAWDKFMDLNKPRDTEASMTKKLNNLPNAQGFGEGDDLAAACKKSKFIWWYGSDHEWTSTKGKKAITYKPGYLYTQAGETHKLSKSKHENNTPESDEAKISFNKYLNSAHGKKNWGGNPGVVIVCSATYEKPKLPITLQANSRTFEYNGKNHTVSGWTYVNNTNKNLKPGHRIEASASKTARNPGVYDVKFSSINILDSSNKNVNNEYSGIKGLEGKLIIWNKPPESQEGPLWRCVNPKTESVTAYTKNGTSGSHVYSPGGRMNNDSIQNVTPAGKHAADGWTLPVYGDSISVWNNWKSTFVNGSRTNMTPELNLEGMGVSEILSRHGGVYEITKVLTKDTYTATHCQPQTREKIEKCDTFYRSDGSKYKKCWTELTPWKDDGPRMIDSTSKKPSEKEYSSYQLFAVNCNEKGFNEVKKEVGGTVITNGKGSGMLKTPTRSGPNAGRLGKRSHKTARPEFYTDGKSCQEVYNCTVKRQIGANNDSDNNLNENPLFTQEVKIDTHNKVNEDNQLVFFRDNNDRTVRADVWYVRNTGQSDLTSYPKDRAKQTYVKLYGGTPELAITTIHPLGMESEYFKPTDSGVKSWNEHINKFNIRSQWASDEGKPYELGINWKYEAEWKNSVPGRVNGDNVLSNVSNDGKFDVYCEFKNTKGTYPANIPKIPHVNGYSNSPKWNPAHALRVIFSRAVTNHNSEATNHK